jgi:hypothetical protein
MTACDYCLSDCSDGSRNFDDEDCGPSRECFHVDLGGPGEGNHLGIPENGDPSRPAPRVDILRELVVVPVPARGQDSQLEQIREGQARLDEGAGTLEQFRRNTRQEWADRAPPGEARHLPQGIQLRIVDDVRARPPPASSGVGQNLAAAAILLRAMPEPSTTEGQRIEGELKNLLEDAAVRQAESSAYRRQGYPSEHHTATSRFMREARSTPGTHATQRLRPWVASATSTTTATFKPTSTRGCAEATTLGVGDVTTAGRIRVPRPNHPALSRAIRRAPFPTRFRTPTTITKYSGETRPELWLVDCRLACQLGGTDDDNLIIRNLPLFLSDTARAWLEHLPLGQISNWDNLVQAFTGNFQGTYVRPGNS